MNPMQSPNTGVGRNLADREVNYPILIHISYAHFYEYNGWKFEWHRTKPIGPWPLKSDMEPRARAGSKFYNDISGFFDLSETEQEKLRI
jgi:hypothetical protein